MKKVKVTPYYRKGDYSAPAIIVYVDETKDDVNFQKEASKKAREKSGLGRFEEWEFGQY